MAYVAFWLPKWHGILERQGGCWACSGAGVGLGHGNAGQTPPNANDGAETGMVSG